MGIEDRLSELGVELPEAPTPVATYVPVVVTGNLAFVSGMVAMHPDGSVVNPGHVGNEVSLEEGQEAARGCAIRALAALRAELGSLDRITRVVQLTVYVASAAGFTEQPKVANGASDFLVELFGDAGKHSRAAVGVAELPLNVPVEVSVVVEIAAP